MNARLLSIRNINQKGSQNTVLYAIEDEDCFTCEGIKYPGKLYLVSKYLKADQHTYIPPSDYY
jgi:hypothetical protein